MIVVTDGGIEGAPGGDCRAEGGILILPPAIDLKLCHACLLAAPNRFTTYRWARARWC